MAEEPAPPPPRPADLGGTPAPPTAVDAPKSERVHDAAPEEVSAPLAASETRTTKFLAVRFAELGEALSGLAKAVESSGEQAAPEPKPPEDDGKAAAADLEKRIRAFAADFDRWRELQRNDNRRLFLAGGSAAAICLLLLGLFLQAQTGILPRRDPTNGWKDHVWTKYGSEIVDCETRIRRAGKAARCEIAFPAKQRRKGTGRE